MSTKVYRLSQLSSTSSFSIFSGAALCFGHFNTIHPGHIRYFRGATQYGSPLVVAVEGDKQFIENQLVDAFNEDERALAVAALNMVDIVVLLDDGRLEDLIVKIEISALILGKEFERSRAGKVSEAVRCAKVKGVKIFYEAGETHYTTTEFLHGTLRQLEEERWKVFEIAQKANEVDLRRVLSKFSEGAKPNILVLGDTIIDRYVACDPVGMSSEAPVIVLKELQTQDYVGGAAIVAAHVAALGGLCTFVSVVGQDEPAEFARESLTAFGVVPDLIVDNSRPTTFKTRYLVENRKMFRISRLKEHSISTLIEDQLINKIQELAPNLDGIVVSDFVYGVVTPRTLDVLQSISRSYNIPLFGDLQCSSQIGNILKFKDFRLICPTEREARIALSNYDDGVEYIANLLLKHTHTTNLIMKLGANGFIAYEGVQHGEFIRRQHYPALIANPVDVTGAGDSLLATASMGLVKGLSLVEVSALASCVAAIAVQTVGNHPVTLDRLGSFVTHAATIR